MNGDLESVIGGLDQLKAINHKVSISFNKPAQAKAGTVANFEIFPGGKNSEKKYQELENRFKKSSKFDMKAFAQENECSINDAFDAYAQIKFKVKKGVDKKALGLKIEKYANDLEDGYVKSGKSLAGKEIFRVKCVVDGDYLCVGKHVVIPHRVVDEKFESSD